MKLVARRLIAARGGQAVAGPIDMDLGRGDALVLTGENGVGKSTLLRTVAGLLPAGGGGLTFTYQAARGLEPITRVAEGCHFLGHRNAMKPGLTVRQNLAFWQAFLGERRTSANGANEGSIEAALDQVGLLTAADLPTSYLSAGQQRRAAIARLLVSPRPLWILDEPTAALDAASQNLFARLLAGHLSAGGALLAATHQPLGIEAEEFKLLARERLSDRQEAALAAAEGWL